MYGVWDGKVHDYRSERSAGFEVTLAGLDDFAPDNPTKAFIANRGFLVLDPDISLAEAFSQYMNHAASESCGRCTPCRVGTQRMRDLLKGVVNGSASGSAFHELEELAEQVSSTSLCGLGQSCSRALLDALRHFRDELKPLSPAQAVFQHSFAYTTAPCIEACPSKIDVPKYIDGVKGGKFDFALGVILEKYSMAATCGRVCVRFCEDACRRAGAEGAVGIRMLKRYAADQALANDRLKFTRPSVQHPQRVAVVGAGPAGITCAYKLLLEGFQVDVFDAQKSSGGMALIGIPSYRLPKDVVKAESDGIVRQLGGNFFYGKVLGRDFTVDALLSSGYDAVFLGYGASLGTTLGVRNEEQKPEGYTSGVDFLFNVHKHVEYGEPFAVSGDVVVVGGGNVAMDCVRSALRMGARSVHLVYRRTLDDMPCEHDEVRAAEEEGVIFHCLVNPSALVIDNGKLQGVELVRMCRGERDATGRRSVEAIPGSEFFMCCDLLIAAIGQKVDEETLQADEGIERDRWHCVKVNPDTLETSRRGVFAGGDCVLGPQPLVNALDHGERAAASIRDYLLRGEIHLAPAFRMQKLLARNRLLDGECLNNPVRQRPRAPVPELDAAERITSFAEVDGVLTKDDAYEEARRCLRCYRIYSIVTAKALNGGHAIAHEPKLTAIAG